MLSAALPIFCYTLVHVAPLDALIFYIFRDYLRHSVQQTALGYLLLLLLETGVQLQQGSSYHPGISLLFQFIYAAYDLYAIRAYAPKILSIGFLTVPIELLSYSIANYAGQQQTKLPPDLQASLILLLIFSAAIFFALRYIDPFLQPILHIHDHGAWRCLFYYETVMIILTALIDPLSTTLTLRIFLSRLILLLNDIACLYIMQYLMRSIAAREYSSHMLDSLHELQSLERQKYNIVMLAWKRSRRLRHDLKHHFIILDALLQHKDYQGIVTYLESICQQLQKPDP